MLFSSLYKPGNYETALECMGGDPSGIFTYCIPSIPGWYI